jgi:hypothetical protein
MAASVSKSCVPDYFRCHISECTQIPPEPINGQRDKCGDLCVRPDTKEAVTIDTVAALGTIIIPISSLSVP